MPPRKGHPPAVAELQAYSLGKLDAERAAEVEAFLAEHPEHAAVLDSTPDDELLRHLRGAGASVFETAPPGPTTPADTEPLPPEAAEEALADHPRYRLLGKLGEGGMGTVFLAEHRLMHRLVALKVIRPQCLAHPLAVERFRREVRMAARLSHPNVVSAYDADEVGGTHVLVLEYVEGVPLSQWLAERGPLPAAEACEYVRQAARGLQYAHERGLVHRDVKPHNLMRTPEGVVKLLDFGLARLAGETADGHRGPLTEHGAVMGTADYLAPEQARDSGSADIRADVYSLGCTLYHLLTGRPPFPEGTSVDKILLHARERPTPLAGLRPDLPAALVRVVETMMARTPPERHQTPAEVADALEPFTRGAPAPAAPPPEHRRLLAGVMAGLLVLAVAAAVVYHIRTDEGELTITTEDADVEVVVRQGGRVVRILDPKTEQSVTLRSGTYELGLKGGEGLSLDLDRATLARGGRVLARVERRPKPPAPPAWAVAELPDKVGWFRRAPSPPNAMNYSPMFSRDGRLLGLTVDDRPTDGAYKRFVETATGRLVRQIGYNTEGITDLRFLADGRRVLTCSKSRARGTFLFRVWDLATDATTELPIESPPGWPYAFSLSADDRRLAFSVSPGLHTRVVDVASGALLLEVAAPPDRPDARLYTVLSADGRRAATWTVWGDPRSSGRLRLDDLDEKHPPRTLEVGRCLDKPFFTPDGRQLGILAGVENEPFAIDYWAVPSFEHLRREMPRTGKGDEADPVEPLAGTIRPWIRLGYKDRSQSLFDPMTGREVHRIGPVEKAIGIDQSPDGRALIFWNKTEHRLYRLPDG